MPKTSSAPGHVSQSSETIAETNIQYLALEQLALSPTNVRKTPATPEEDAELEASIRAKGVQQNLIVHPAEIDGKTLHLVDAGGRRLKILQKLATEGVIDAKTYQVPCKIERAEDALETSLTENTIRAAMHPADEFIAMAALIDAGATIADVVKRFGCSERHVKQRLRLGKLAPELLDAYRADQLNLETVTAFTLGADHDAQRAVWNQLKDNSYISPHRVRHLLTDAAIALDSDLGLFVGIDAYKAAGGIPTEDLFSSDNDGFMPDAALVNRLAIEKLEAKAAELHSEWAWTKAVLDPDYGFLAQYARVEPKPGKLPAELAEERERIDQRIDELQGSEIDWTDDLDAELAKLEQRRAEIDDIADSLAVFSKKDRKRAGCIVTIGEDGKFFLYQGLIDPATLPKTDTDTGDDTLDGSFETEDDGQNASAHPSAGCEQAVRKELGFSQGLVDDLKAHRQQITRAHLAGNFEVAFDLALYTLASQLLYRGYRSHPLDFRVNEARTRSSLNDLGATVADKLLEAHRTALDLAWFNLPPVEAFAALSALSPASKQRLFAWCIAASVNPQLGIEDRADTVLECAGQRLAIPFADCWRPTAANYWARVKKAHGLAIGGEILGERWARDHADDKKATLATALETAFDPAKNGACLALPQSVRDNAAAWLPPGMDYIAIAAAADDDSRTDDIDHRSTENAADLPAFLTDDDPDVAVGTAAV